MDISIVSENSIKLKGKSIVFIVDPALALVKTNADAIILLNGVNGDNNIDKSRVVDSRIIINGPGEYEVGGTKVSGTSTPKGILYKLSIDEISIILGKTEEIRTEGFNECQVAVINTDGEFIESFVTGLEPKITVLYGGKKKEAAQALGAENAVQLPKITITKDKLPEKMEIMVLG